MAKAKTQSRAKTTLGVINLIGVYKIANSINGKTYIGQSRNIENRIKGHKQAIKRSPEDKRGQGPLYDDMRKFGVENFEVEILKLCELDDLNEWEEYYINAYNSVENGYNISNKAVTTSDPAVMAKIQTENVRRERSEHFTKMNLKNWDDPAYRRKRSIESSKLQKERLKDPEYLKQKSEQLSRHWKKKKRRVAQYTFDGELVKTYDGIREAERESGFHIHNHLNHPDKRKQAGGYVWKYIE